MRILALVGKNVDEREVISLLGPGDFELARYGKLSRGVRRLEKFPADTVLLVPNAEDDTWPRAVRRIREEHHVRSVVVLPDDRKRETGLDAGAFDVFRWDSVTSDDLERSFRHLARQVELEDRLCQTRTMFDWVEETGRLGSWSMDEQGRTIWSRGARRILNDTDGKLTTAFDSVRSFVHPEDLEIYEQANKATFDQGWPLDFEYRVRVGEDDLRYLHLHRRVEHGRSGDVFHAFGLLRDVTAEREFENFLFPAAAARMCRTSRPDSSDAPWTTRPPPGRSGTPCADTPWNSPTRRCYANARYSRNHPGPVGPGAGWTRGSGARQSACEWPGNQPGQRHTGPAGLRRKGLPPLGDTASPRLSRG